MTLKIRDKVIILSFGLVVATAGIIVTVFYSGTTNILVDKTIEEMVGNLRLNASELEEDLEALRNDVRFISTMPPIQGIIRAHKGNGYDPQGNSSTLQWQQRLEIIFRQFLLSKPTYYKIRYIGIDAEGKELVRVDQTESGPRAISRNELQSKSNRDYFQNSLILSNGEVYLSDVSLNREKGEILIPHTPVLRAVTPVFSPDGVLFGFVVISKKFGTNLVRTADRFNQLGQLMYITNSVGDYLVHPDHKKEYGFELGTPHRLLDEHPGLFDYLHTDHSGGGVDVLEVSQKRNEVYALTEIPLSIDKTRFILMSLSQNHSTINNSVRSILTNMLWVSLALIFMGSIFALWYSRRLIMPLLSITNGVESFRTKRESVELPVGLPDEFGILARAFETLFKDVNESQALLEEVRINLEANVEERVTDLQQELVARQKTEQNLADSESRIRAIFENVVDGIITIDDEGAIETVNPATERIFGYSSREMVGQNVKMLMPDPYHSEHDPYLEHFLTTGEKKIIGLGREVRGRRSDGSIFPLELAVSEMTVDNKIKFSGIVRDISVRHQDERQIRDSEARNRAILETVVDGIITIDDEGTIETVNPATEEIFAYSSREMVGQNVKMLMPDPYQSEHDAYLEHYFSTGEKRVIGIGREVQGRRSDGSIFPLELAVNEMIVDDKRMFTGIVRDITERKKMEILKNEFVSTVSHELRTPLTSIRGSLGLLVGGVIEGLPEKARSLLDIAHNNTERLLMLINDILDIEKIESGKISFNFEKIDLMELVEEAIVSNQAYADQYNTHFTIARRVEQGFVYADSDRLMQVLSNLMSNAAKFSPAGSVIEVIATKYSGNIRISISDHGPGIPESFRRHIFEKFTQSDASDTRQIGGTGLGLSITKAIVERHGGKIDFVTKEGVGTTFFFDLPEMSGGESLGDLGKEFLLSGKKKIIRKFLIVENDENAASLLQLLLAEDGYESDVAMSAAEAKQLLAEKKYIAMTLDIMLPDVDGISFLRELRAEVETRELPIVIISEKADITRRELNGNTMDVVDWLNKPIDRDRLVMAVGQAVSSATLPNILHVEDDEDVTLVVSTLLAGQANVVSARNIDEATTILGTQKFDLILLDVGLPGKSGLEFLDDLLERNAVIPVIIFSAHDVDKEVIGKVNGYLVKSSTSNKKLVDTITSVLQK